MSYPETELPKLQYQTIKAEVPIGVVPVISTLTRIGNRIGAHLIMLTLTQGPLELSSLLYYKHMPEG